ncbi:hypothetical protein [Aquitalea sp. FJL05]|uniref:hypothetical protein n=1 Tax=Aquitalea sp. FJL05 TaxID=2153366 RepID=UPI000F5B7FC5|nr:hypothetical protein [Aquitalea sp. FJL05]
MTKDSLLSIQEICTRLGNNTLDFDILKLIYNKKIPCFIECPDEFSVYAEGEVIETIHVIMRSIKKKQNEIESPIKFSDVSYLKICNDDVEYLTSNSTVRLSRFDGVLIGRSLELQSRRLCVSNYYFIAPENKIIPESGLFEFHHRINVHLSDLYINPVDFDKLKKAYFSECIENQLIVSNDYVTLLNLCAYEFYKDGLGREYHRDDVVNLILNSSVKNVSISENDARYLAAIISRENSTRGEFKGEVATIWAESDLPDDVRACKKHECFSVKLIIINYLFHMIDGELILRNEVDKKLKYYGFRKIQANLVSEFLWLFRGR